MILGTQQNIASTNGGEITIETGKLAKQADGSVVVKQGGTMLLATVVASKDAINSRLQREISFNR